MQRPFHLIILLSRTLKNSCRRWATWVNVSTGAFVQLWNYSSWYYQLLNWWSAAFKRVVKCPEDDIKQENWSILQMRGSSGEGQGDEFCGAEISHGQRSASLLRPPFPLPPFSEAPCLFRPLQALDGCIYWARQWGTLKGMVVETRVVCFSALCVFGEEKRLQTTA